jgi:hypothetical protein
MYVYRYLKKCRVCESVYYNKEITEGEFHNIWDYPAIELDFETVDGYTLGTVTLTSLCPECVRIVNSPLA